MSNEAGEGFEGYFGELKDPRIDRKKLYPLIEILFVALCGMICGAESWRDFCVVWTSKTRIFKGLFHICQWDTVQEYVFAGIFSARARGI